MTKYAIAAACLAMIGYAEIQHRRTAEPAPLPVCKCECEPSELDGCMLRTAPGGSCTMPDGFSFNSGFTCRCAP